MDKVRLNVVYSRRVISIPFKDLKMVDQFTMRFMDGLDICASIDGVFNLGIDKSQFLGVQLYYISKKNGIIEKPVRYSIDNYDMEKIKEVYCKFFQDDITRIRKWEYGLRHVKKHDAIDNYVFGRSDTISDSQIQKAVNSYLNTDYQKHRDAYFTLIQHNYKVVPKDNDVSKKSEFVRRNDLSKYQVEKEYLQSLKEYAMQGEEQSDRAMDILAGYDIEDIERDMVNSEYSLFDGIPSKFNKEQYIRDLYEEDYMALEYFSGRNIDELKELSNKYNEGKIGRKR